MQVESIKLFPRLMKILIPRHPMLKFEHTIIEDTKSKIYISTHFKSIVCSTCTVSIKNPYYKDNSMWPDIVYIHPTTMCYSVLEQHWTLLALDTGRRHVPVTSRNEAMQFFLVFFYLSASQLPDL